MSGQVAVDMSCDEKEHLWMILLDLEATALLTVWRASDGLCYSTKVKPNGFSLYMTNDFRLGRVYVESGVG